MTRFVDDFRMFLKGTDPYDALGYLAQQLGINEGLSYRISRMFSALLRSWPMREISTKSSAVMRARASVSA